MIERLARALEHVEEVPEDVQEEIAELIEELTEPLNDLPQATIQPGDEVLPKTVRDALSVIGAWRDLPDDMEETLLRWRRESAPTPPIEEQLAWMKDDEG